MDSMTDSIPVVSFAQKRRVEALGRKAHVVQLSDINPKAKPQTCKRQNGMDCGECHECDVLPPAVRDRLKRIEDEIHRLDENMQYGSDD